MNNGNWTLFASESIAVHDPVKYTRNHSVEDHNALQALVLTLLFTLLFGGL